MSSQRIGKYACLEIEHRYLLRELPTDLKLEGNYWLIKDRYLTGTRLRLRSMTNRETRHTIYKFGQKFQAEDQTPGQVSMTNMYLTLDEYKKLTQLEAREIVKKRYRYIHNGLRYGIDVFEGHLQGLILAEIECETMEEYHALSCPPFAVREVTDEYFFTGGNLVGLSREEFLEKWENAAQF